MTKKPDETHESRDDDTIVVDRRYIRDQANQAFRSFVAPLSGVYDAAFGPTPSPLPGADEKPKERI